MIALLGIENQTTIDKVMPFRVLTYDFLNYINQFQRYLTTRKILRRKKKKVPDLKFIPVITIVLNFNERHWNKARSLKDMMRSIHRDNDKYINDWKVHIVDVYDIDYTKFKLKENRDLIEGLQRLYQSEGDLSVLEDMDITRETAIEIFTISKSEKALEFIKTQKEEGFEMCTAMRLFEENAINKGVNIGLKQGIEQGIDQGLRQGLERGVQQGMNNAQSLLVKTVIEQLQVQLGKLEEETVSKIEESTFDELLMIVPHLSKIKNEKDILNCFQ